MPILDKTLLRAAQACAIFGTLVMVVFMGATVLSVLGRWLFSKPLLGDIEVTQVGMAMAISAYLPLCQLNQGNIIVDFFTSRADPRWRAGMDGAGALLMAVLAGLLAWRTAAGAVSAHQGHATTTLLQWPEWITYAVMVPPLALTALIALRMSAGALRAAARG